MPLFYDTASSDRGNPSSDSANIGASACEPGVINADHLLFLTIEQMEIGSGGTLDVWLVKPTGEATLGPTPTLEHVPVKKIGTVSIRDARVNGGFGPEAGIACGDVTHAAEGPQVEGNRIPTSLRSPDRPWGLVRAPLI